MTRDESYGVGPCITFDLPVIQAHNERMRLLNIESERRYRQEIENLNRTTDSEIWR